MKLKYDETLSNFSFNFKLRRYPAGNSAGEMGAALPAVNLPDGAVVVSLALSGYLTCAVVVMPASSWYGTPARQEVVCWGHSWMMAGIDG